MNNLINIIKEAQKKLFCPICKRRYEITEIKLKGFFDDTYILQTDCANNHQPIVMNVIVQKAQNKIEPINKDNLLIQAIDNFNGDFENLWK